MYNTIALLHFDSYLVQMLSTHTWGISVRIYVVVMSPIPSQTGCYSVPSAMHCDLGLAYDLASPDTT